jgi:hypothetical protein
MRRLRPALLAVVAFAAFGTVPAAHACAGQVCSLPCATYRQVTHDPDCPLPPLG